MLPKYERDGYAVFRAVIDPDLVAEASAHVDWLLARHPDRRPELLDSLTLMEGDAFWCRPAACRSAAARRGDDASDRVR